MAQPNRDCLTQDRFALLVPPAPSAKKLMGVYRDWWKHADARVAEACDRALDWFAGERGYQVVDNSIPCLAEAQLAHGAICIAEMAETARRWTPNPADWLSLCGPANKVLTVGSKTPVADYLKYNALRTLLMRHLAFLFQYVFLANMTGTPSLSAPVAYVDPEQGEGRLPVSLLATGDWGSEEQLLSWAAEAEDYLHGTYADGQEARVVAGRAGPGAGGRQGVASYVDF